MVPVSSASSVGSLSSTAVTVTGCSMSQLAGVNVRLVSLTVMSVLVGAPIVTVTLAVGSLSRTTV